MTIFRRLPFRGIGGVQEPAFRPGYYVDATLGNDANDGRSPGKAWQTIAKVNASTFNAGDYILFKSGEVFRGRILIPSSGTTATPIILGAYGTGDQPLISATALAGVWTNEAGNIWYIDGVLFSPQVVFFDDVLGTEEALKANLNADLEWWWDDPNDRLYIYSTNNPNTEYTDPGIDYSDATNCIAATNKDYILLDGLAFRGCDASVQGAIYGDDVGGDGSVGWEIRNCTFDGVGGHAIRCRDYSTDWIIHNNTFDNVKNSCVFIDSFCDDARIYANTINTGNGFGSTGDRLAIGVNEATGVKIYLNTIMYDGGGDLIELAADDPNDVDVEIYRNWLDFSSGDVAHNVMDFATASTGTLTALIHYNVIIGNANEAAWCLDDGDSPVQAQFYNNVFIDCDEALEAYDDGAVDVDCILIVKNNIFYNSTTHHIRVKSGWVASATIDIDDNLYYDDVGTKLEWNGTEYNFANWKTNSGQDGSSPNPADPVFVGGGDYHLQSGSPARNAGTNVGLSVDYDGVSVPQETNPAIGAYEYV